MHKLLSLRRPILKVLFSMHLVPSNEASDVVYRWLTRRRRISVEKLLWRRVSVEQGSCGCHIHLSSHSTMSKFILDHSHIQHEGPLFLTRSISNLSSLNKTVASVKYLQHRWRSH